MNPQIKHRYTGAVLFEGESGMTTRQILEKATAAKVNLSGSNLSYSSLGEKFGQIIVGRAFFQCGPIGSRSDYLQSFITDKGVVIKAGCFTGFLDEFVAACETSHGNNNHGKEYAMAVVMIEAHVAIWGGV